MTWYLDSMISALGCFFNFVLLVVEFDALIDVYLIRSNSIYLRSKFDRTKNERKAREKVYEERSNERANVAYSYPQKPSLIRSILHSIYSALYRFHQDFSSNRKKVE